MTRVLLIRHASCEETGRRLHGRTPGVRLSPNGVREAQDLAERLRDVPVCAVYTSPVERAVQTARAVAGPHALEPVTDPAFEEIDFGSWTGRTISALEGEAAWASFNALRSLSRAPAGELMLETQMRAVNGLIALRGRHEGETFAVVSHADVLRAVIAYLLGMPLDHVLRLEIAPASVSTVRFNGAWPQLLHLNCVGGGVPEEEPCTS